MYLKINGTEISCPEGTTWMQAYAMLPAEQKCKNPLGIRVGGETKAMIDPAMEYAHAQVLTFDDEEGRRIYERSLMLLYITAVRRVRPDVHVRIEHSYGRGLYTSLQDMEADDAFVRDVEAEMHRLAEARLPYARKRVSTDDAQDYFARTGQLDRLRILNYRRFPYFTLYSIGDGPEDYFYGIMAPDTGSVRVFKLVKCDRGVVVMRPKRTDSAAPAEFEFMPKLQQVFLESSEWNRILNCRNAADLNAMVEQRKIREFIRVNEALQEHKIDEIAQQFIASGARLILIAGPSSSGKTTFSNRLSIALRVYGLRPVKISLDDYYRNRDQLPREADGSIDFERIDTLDTHLISDHLTRLMAGETVELPEYDFTTGMRKDKTHPMRVEDGQPIIIEGIHGLNDRLTEGIDRAQKFKIYISALTVLNLDDHNRIRTTDARLLRRIVRDNLFRGTLPEETMSMWDSVRRGEVNYIFPYQEQADAMINSSLTYELVIMKKYAFPLLMAVHPDSPHYTMAQRLLKFLNYIQVADVEDEIPINSILREFIGGNVFYRNND